MGYGLWVGILATGELSAFYVENQITEAILFDFLRCHIFYTELVIP
jgi:hypothetical protein